MAMAPSNAIQGYYFKDIHHRQAPAVAEHSRRLDYKEEWAVAGIPVSYGKTGIYTFLIDETQVIRIKDTAERLKILPHNPEAEGWTSAETVEDVKRAFQKKQR